LNRQLEADGMKAYMRFLFKRENSEDDCVENAPDLGPTLLRLAADAIEISDVSECTKTASELRKSAQYWETAELQSKISRSESIIKLYERSRASQLNGFRENLLQTRDLLWTFVKNCVQQFSDNRNEETLLESQVRLLQRAAQKGTLEELRKATLETAQMLTRHLEFQRLKREGYQKTLSEEFEKLQKQLEQLKWQRDLDGLTQIYNRRALDEHLDHVVSLCQLMGRQVSLCLFDLDFFKKMNDTHGHAAGDAVLRSTAQSLLSSFPSKRDFVARFGGEEFCVVLLEEDCQGALSRAQDFAKTLAEKKTPFEEKILQCTVSGGVAKWRLGESPTQWLKRADEALYRAKLAGRNRILPERMEERIVS
jgi:diguanylate cyclase